MIILELAGAAFLLLWVGNWTASGRPNVRQPGPRAALDLLHLVLLSAALWLIVQAVHS